VLLSLVACGGQPASKPAASPAPAAAAAADAVSASGGSQLLGIIPPPGTPEGWSRTKPPQAFGADDLWEFIDGAAETYLAFGFQEALSAGHAFGGTEVTVEVYRMAGSLNAWGIFMQELPPSAGFLQLGRDGYAGSNVVVFWKGACYVKLTAPAADRPGQARLVALARAIADRLPEGDPLPPEIAWFPPDGLTPHSVRLVPKDILGQGYLANGFQAQYEVPTGACTLVVVPFDTPAAAAAALDRYGSFLASDGKARIALKGPGNGGFSGDAGFHGQVVALRFGARLVFALGAAGRPAATALAAGYITRASAARQP
jgi:hypothetical protein